MARKKKEKVNKWKLPKEEAKIQAREKRIRRAFRVTRLRALKNFFYWFFGVLSSIGIVAGAIFIGVGVVPLSTLIGKDTASEYVSSNVYDKSLINAILGMEGYTFADFPIIEQSLKDALGEDNSISVLNDYQKVKTPTLTEESGRYKITEDLNASDYYYVVSQTDSGVSPMSEVDDKVEYAKAFDENGYLISSLNEKYKGGSLELFYPPLFDLPVVEGLSKLGEYVTFFELTDLLKLALGSGYEEGSLIDKAFSGLKVGDLTTNESEEGVGDKVMSKLTLSALGVNSLGDFGDQKFFNEFEKVKVTIPASGDDPEIKGDYPATEIIESKEFITKDESEKFTSNPKQYYIELVAHVPASEGVEEVEGEYVRAFTNDGEFKTEYTKNDGTTVSYANLAEVENAGTLCYANLSKISLTDTFDLLDESIDRMAISKLALGDYESNEKLYDILLSASGNMPVRGETQTDEQYTASKKDAAEALTMSAFDTLDVDAVKLSVVLGEYSEPVEDDPSTPDVDESEAGTKKLYDIILSANGTMPVQDVEGGETDEAFAIRVKDAANDLTLSALDGGLDIDSVKLTVVLPYKAEILDNPETPDVDEGDAGTEKLYSILLDVTKPDPLPEGKTDWTIDDITIGHLNSFATDAIKLSSVLDVEENKQLYDILCSAIPDSTPETITIADFSEFKSDNIQLSIVLPFEWAVEDDPDTLENESDPGTEKLYKIIISAKGWEFPERTDSKYAGEDGDELYEQDVYALVDAIKVSDLNGLDIDNVNLTVVLPRDEGTEDLYKILIDVTRPANLAPDQPWTENDIKISSLKTFETGKIRLFNVLPYKDAEGDNPGTAKLYQILMDVTETNDYTTITVGSLSNFDTDKIKLVSVLPRDSGTENLYKILIDVTTPENLEPGQIWTENDIKISSLKSFDTDKIKLNSVITSSDNKILSALLQDTENPVTIGNLGTRINGLGIDTVVNCEDFTTETGSEHTNNESAIYRKVTNNDGALVAYVLDGTTKLSEYTGNSAYIVDTETNYYISNKASIWLFVLYSYESIDGNGNAIEYKPETVNIGNMADVMAGTGDYEGKGVGKMLEGATIRQLVNVGILTDKESFGYDLGGGVTMYQKTLETALGG